MFKAVLIEKDDAGYRAAVKDLDEASLPEGDVGVRMEYSSLNYKDRLAITGRGAVVRMFPMVAGIDLVGTVESSAHPGVAVIHSTIDLELQMAAQARLAEYAERLDPRTSAALLVLDHRSGAVLAYAGGVAFGDRRRAGHLDLVRAQRSPGSTLKPFIYGLPMTNGQYSVTGGFWA